MSANPPPSRPVAGILWMLLSGALLVAVTAIVKHVGQSLPSSQAAFIRYGFGALLMLPVLMKLRLVPAGRRSFGLHWVRGTLHGIGVLLWFYAMTRISIAEVTALNYMNPVYVTVGAALFLGETLSLRRISAVAVAFIGGLVILRPGFREISDGHVAMLIAAVIFAGSYLIAKRMTAKVDPAMMVAMLSLTVTCVQAPFAFAVWVSPGLVELAWLVLLACFATGAHYTMTLAFVAAPVSVTQPVVFLQLVWAVLLGALFFDEPADVYVILGGTIVMGAVSFITWREALDRRRSAGAAAPRS